MRKPFAFAMPKSVKLYVAFESNEDIFQADVAVDDAQRRTVIAGFCMRVRQSASNTARDENRQFSRKSACAP